MNKLVKLGLISMASLVLVACGTGDTESQTEEALQDETELIQEEDNKVIGTETEEEVDEDGNFITTERVEIKDEHAEYEEESQSVEHSDGSRSYSSSSSESVDFGAIMHEEALQALEEDPSIPVFKESELSELTDEDLEEYDRIIIESDDESGEQLMLMDVNG